MYVTDCRLQGPTAAVFSLRTWNKPCRPPTAENLDNLQDICIHEHTKNRINNLLPAMQLLQRKKAKKKKYRKHLQATSVGVALATATQLGKE